MTATEPLLDTSTLAAELGVTKRWIYSQVEEHGLPCYRFGKSLAFEASAVRAWLNYHRAGTWPEDCGVGIPADFISGNMQESEVG